MLFWILAGVVMVGVLQIDDPVKKITYPILIEVILTIIFWPIVLLLFIRYKISIKRD